MRTSRSDEDTVQTWSLVLSDTSTPAAGEKKNRQQHKDSRIKKIKNPKSHHATRNVHTHTNKYNTRIKKNRKEKRNFFF
jgi:hypothetical protein